MTAFRFLVFLLAPVPLAAQALDSTQIRYRDALVALRDDLTQVGAGVQALQRDLGTAADVTIIAKTGRLQAACRDARSALAERQSMFLAVRGAARRTRAARGLVNAMRSLDAQFEAHCLAGLRSGEAGIIADSVRAWLPYRARQMRDAEQAYHEAAAAFARAVGVRIPPVQVRGR